MGRGIYFHALSGSEAPLTLPAPPLVHQSESGPLELFMEASLLKYASLSY